MNDAVKKAYDLKDLEAKLIAQGLPIVEQLAEKVYLAVEDWIKESAPLSTNTIDDVIVPLAFPIIDKYILEAIKKI